MLLFLQPQRRATCPCEDIYMPPPSHLGQVRILLDSAVVNELVERGDLVGLLSTQHQKGKIYHATHTLSSGRLREDNVVEWCCEGTKAANLRGG